ncbi:hypothetical protein HRR82_004107 [Exophiala dermatitidis]|nr:hypothetical protein HRR82_004107 [Exophiala dermatitidis]
MLQDEWIRKSKSSSNNGLLRNAASYSGLASQHSLDASKVYVHKNCPSGSSSTTGRWQDSAHPPHAKSKRQLRANYKNSTPPFLQVPSHILPFYLTSSPDMVPGFRHWANVCECCKIVTKGISEKLARSTNESQIRLCQDDSSGSGKTGQSERASVGRGSASVGGHSWADRGAAEKNC